MWAESGGASDFMTANIVIAAAMRSIPEWRASEIIARLLVRTPTTIFITVRKMATSRELKAAFSFGDIVVVPFLLWKWFGDKRICMFLIIIGCYDFYNVF